MRIVFYFSLIIFCIKSSSDFVIDRTRAIIYDPNKTIIITERDLAKQNITGEPRILKNLCFEHLVALQAHSMNVPTPDVSEILKKVDEQFIKSTGYTIKEFEEEVIRYQIVNTMLDYRVYSKTVVSQQAILDFFYKNPEYSDAAYYIKRTTLDRSLSEEAIDLLIQNQKEEIPWNEPFWIHEEEIAPEKHFLTELPINEIKVSFTGINYELYTVVAKKEKALIPLENRYQKIVLELKQPLVKKLFEEYQDETFKNAHYIIYE